MSNENKSFIYGIVCHRRNDSFDCLVSELLKSENSIIIVHVDKKADITDFSIYRGMDRIIFVTNRIDVRWGGVSQIEATLELIKLAENYDYSYFSLLSGDDACVRSVQKIECFLNKHDGYEFLGQDTKNKFEHRVKYIHPWFYFKKGNNRSIIDKVLVKICDKAHSIGILRQNMDGVPKLYKGSNWFTLTKKAIEYILNYIKNNPNYIKVYKKSFCADEVFFHTILFNSNLKENIYLNGTYNSLRYVDWKTGPDFPRFLDKTDFEKIKGSDALFARKMSHTLTDSDIRSLISH
ncbi:beta-1,6-N-acetylglucosaminyltransferase [Providencia vermicola]|uniref:beta-1,6-N-acetylglucosaminyltransferase n=1 Tax=Providencia TaxID=586 RepID=UPI00298F50D1|nr:MULTISPECIES: beta-1,6-N-acetylglucosaminyltransferase [unclassified Providencia]